MRRYFIRQDNFSAPFVVSAKSIRRGDMAPMPEGETHYTWRPDSAHSGCARVEFADVAHVVNFVVTENTIFLSLDGFFYRFSWTNLPPSRGAATGELFLKAEIPGRIVKVLAKPGDAVVQGQELIVQEAMKMEITLRAPADLIIRALHVTEGAQVQADAVLLAFEPPQEMKRS